MAKRRIMSYQMDQLLQNLGAELSNRILNLGAKKLFASNQYIFFEGDIATFLPIVLSGKIKMVRFPEPGKEIILGLFRSGDVFAIPPALDGRQFPATAIAIEKSEVLLLPREDFLGLMGSSSDFSSAIMGRMCGILRERTDTVQILATSSAEQRVARVLLRLAGDFEIDAVKKIQHRRQDIAEMAGLSLETTIRVIRKMATKGCFNIVGGRILIESTEPLRELVL